MHSVTDGRTDRRRIMTRADHTRCSKIG